LSEDPPAEREALGGPLEGGSMDRGFSVVTGGRTPSFRDLSVGEALASHLEEAGRTAEGASFPYR
jgi:ribosomal protein S18 acetylase RimI-like enzyme